MQLDWFTTVAQIVNFLILVALLKRFLYGPIVRAMDSREARITARLHEAEDKLAVAEQQMALYHDRLHELDARRDTLLVQAREDAEAQRQHLLEQARQEVQQAQARWRTMLQQERMAFLQELRQQAGQQVCAVARQALTDLASVDLERAVVDHFLDRLQGVDDEVRYTLAAAAHAEGVVVRSAFPMPSDSLQV
jgi:F-type H+-transporting ATPase subunit b